MTETVTTGNTSKQTTPKKKFKGGKPATQKRIDKKGKKSKEVSKPVVVAKVITPVFLYTSKCCGASTHKEPLVWSAKDKEENKFSENHKGHFRCDRCGKSCSVTRERNKEGVTITL